MTRKKGKTLHEIAEAYKRKDPKLGTRLERAFDGLLIGAPIPAIAAETGFPESLLRGLRAEINQGFLRGNRPDLLI